MCPAATKQWGMFSGPGDVFRGIWFNKTFTVCSVLANSTRNIWSAQRKEEFQAKGIWSQSRQQAKTPSPDGKFRINIKQSQQPMLQNDSPPHTHFSTCLSNYFPGLLLKSSFPWMFAKVSLKKSFFFSKRTSCVSQSLSCIHIGGQKVISTCLAGAPIIKQDFPGSRLSNQRTQTWF